jgi:hypothetical protein
MAKRKRRPGRGSKLRPIKDYREDKYVPYIFKAETGIVQAWAIDPDLRDGDVREALRGLISPLKKSGVLPEILTKEVDASADSSEDEEIRIEGGNQNSLLQTLMLNNLRQAFEEQGPLEAEDVIGILTVINNSVGSWNVGMRGQGYLNYIKDFLGKMGVQARQLTAEEVEWLGLERPSKLIGGE